ncbi:hypothetical protein HPO_15356 [Hyphomonas polymorpha PS728]|uniref:DUF2274 domain-containing protein n=1 Tax=Hyphomonas polymorpha PS728 TaxID=1280954 RepID=A0A062V5Z2_9PROT|nr:DUF2274 domain-containing protein [Hyphomonas polymorpha]KCZ97421.1 hypothetical protein HPO_15356 [Hyphomonas polymorpha PS728]
MTLRLARLPDRTPVRMNIALEPELAAALQDYAIIYSETYGDTQKAEALIPAMLDTFLSTDTGFRRARRELKTQTGV